MNRKTQITIETHSITIIRATGRQFSTYCEHCGTTVSAFTPEQIATVLQKNITEISSLIESGELHLARPDDAPALICVGREETGGTRLLSVRNTNY